METVESSKTFEFGLGNVPNMAKKLVEQFPSKVYCFKGEMGSGKTTLIKSMIKVLGAEDLGSSPTFSVVNEYQSPQGVIFHMDLYRLKSFEEAIDIGFMDYLNQEAIVMIEWPKIIEEYLDEEYLELTLQPKKHLRTLTIKKIPLP